MFDWFDTKEAKQLGLTLADNVSSEIAMENKKAQKSKKKEMEHKAKIMKRVFVRVSQYKQSSKPNFYKKAKLANTFKWRLLDLGHDADFVEILTKELLLHMG
jgi:hypothetical protein